MAKSDIFVQTTRAYCFKCGDKKKDVPAKFIGYLPEWVTKDPLFGWAESDGSVVRPIQQPTATPVASPAVVEPTVTPSTKDKGKS